MVPQSTTSLCRPLLSANRPQKTEVRMNSPLLVPRTRPIVDSPMTRSFIRTASKTKRIPMKAICIRQVYRSIQVSIVMIVQRRRRESPLAKSIRPRTDSSTRSHLNAIAFAFQSLPITPPPPESPPALEGKDQSETLAPLINRLSAMQLILVRLP